MNIRFNDEASKALKEYIDASEKEAVRLRVLSRGWGKPALGLALDEQGENDIVRTFDNITFLVDRKEETELKNVEILFSPYYINNGFYVRSFSGGKWSCLKSLGLLQI